MKKVRVGYIPLSKHSFDIEWAKKISHITINELKKNKMIELIPVDIIFSDIEVISRICFLKEKSIDLLLIHFCTFCLGTIIPKIFNEINVPVILLAMPEPTFDGSRIRSNALCALNMNCHILHKMSIEYRAYFGSLDSLKLRTEIERTILAIYAIKNINNKRIGLIGSRAPGFYTSNYDELKLRKKFGVEIEHIDISKVYLIAEKVSNKEILREMNYLNKNIGRNNNVAEKDTIKLLKLYTAFKRIAYDLGFDAFAIKCWPEFHEDYGIAICPALGMLNSNDIMTSCEGDIYGVMTMIVQKSIAFSIPFFSDLVHIDESENSGIFWHCGSAPRELAKNKS
ncbi:MAG: hypothetical protein H5T85_05795, partial [Actinobacteria bacterium]|nr:hypothetical protein [Actinomycetota bacterium]